jgi:hypothetical protein
MRCFALGYGWGLIPALINNFRIVGGRRPRLPQRFSGFRKIFMRIAIVLIGAARAWDYTVDMRVEASPLIAPDTLRAHEPFTIDVYFKNVGEITFGFYFGTYFYGSGGISAVTASDVTIDQEFNMIWEMATFPTYASWDKALPDSFSYAGLSLVGWNPDHIERKAFSFEFSIDQEGIFCMNEWVSDWYEWHDMDPLYDFGGPYCWVVAELPKTIQVPADYATLQEALDHTYSGDTVLVARGLYYGSGNRDLDFHGRAVVLLSEDGPTGTFIDCGGSDTASHRGVTFVSGENALAVVDGFTIRNGVAYDDLEFQQGGAILCISSSPTIRNCIFNHNFASSGGGLMCRDSANPHISYCVFSGNMAENRGGGVACMGASPELANCTFYGNGSMNIWYSCGGGVACTDEAVPILNDCIIAFSTLGGAVYCTDQHSVPILACCDIYGNTGGNWNGFISDQATINANFSSDPLFRDAAIGNFFVDPLSPCAPDNNGCALLIGAWGIADYVCGDLNRSGAINMLDIIFLINYLYRDGFIPDPIYAADITRDGIVNLYDIIYLINYLYQGGPPPTC